MNDLEHNPFEPVIKEYGERIEKLRKVWQDTQGAVSDLNEQGRDALWALQDCLLALVAIREEAAKGTPEALNKIIDRTTYLIDKHTKPKA